MFSSELNIREDQSIGNKPVKEVKRNPGLFELWSSGLIISDRYQKDMGKEGRTIQKIKKWNIIINKGTIIFLFLLFLLCSSHVSTTLNKGNLIVVRRGHDGWWVLHSFSFHSLDHRTVPAHTILKPLNIWPAKRSTDAKCWENASVVREVFDN